MFHKNLHPGIPEIQNLKFKGKINYKTCPARSDKSPSIKHHPANKYVVLLWGQIRLHATAFSHILMQPAGLRLLPASRQAGLPSRATVFAIPFRSLLRSLCRVMQNTKPLVMAGYTATPFCIIPEGTISEGTMGRRGGTRRTSRFQ